MMENLTPELRPGMIATLAPGAGQSGLSHSMRGKNLAAAALPGRIGKWPWCPPLSSVPPSMLVDKWRRTCDFAPFGEPSDLTPAMRSPRPNVLGRGGAIPPALDTRRVGTNEQVD
jgi:hypothetical protein